MTEPHKPPQQPLTEELMENIYIRELVPLVSPAEVKAEFPATQTSLETVAAGREAIRELLHPSYSNRLLVVLGPCSVHDPQAALEYASWVAEQRQVFGDQLELVMRLYFEKPRTTVGWEGLIYDPHLDSTNDINTGVRLARQLVRDVTDMGVPVASEILNNITPDYYAGLISWSVIGARTTESPLHRNVVSGLSFPVGFKNATNGDVQPAVDAMVAARHPHYFPATTEGGTTAIAATYGKADTHVVLRGGHGATNYDADSICLATAKLEEASLPQVLMVDASHANSQKDHTKQLDVVGDVALQIAGGSTAIMGVMLESNLVAGKQPFKPGGPHEYGKSITDACIGLRDTAYVLDGLSEAVQKRMQYDDEQLV